MKTDIISKKKQKKKREKNGKKTSNGFLSLKTRFFGPKNGGNNIYKNYRSYR
jgi:hypothetical protein